MEGDESSLFNLGKVELNYFKAEFLDDIRYVCLSFMKSVLLKKNWVKPQSVLDWSLVQLNVLGGAIWA